MHIILPGSTARLERSQTSRRFQRRKSRTSVIRLVILVRLHGLNARKDRYLKFLVANLIVIFVTEVFIVNIYIT